MFITHTQCSGDGVAVSNEVYFEMDMLFWHENRSLVPVSTSFVHIENTNKKEGECQVYQVKEGECQVSVQKGSECQVQSKRR